MNNQDDMFPAFPTTEANTIMVRQTLAEIFKGENKTDFMAGFNNFFAEFNRSKQRLKNNQATPDDIVMSKCLVALRFIPTDEVKNVISLSFSETKTETIRDFFNVKTKSQSQTLKKLYFFTYFHYIRGIVDYRREDSMGKQIADKLTKFFKSSSSNDEFTEILEPKGSYTIFRPAPYDPLGEVLCSTLLIGEGSVAGKDLKPHECAVISDLESQPYGVPRDLKGFYSVMDQSIVMMLRNPHRTDARFLYYVHHVDFFDNKYPNMRGIVTVDTAHKHSASAWPFVAVNNTMLTDEERAVGIKPFAEIGSSRLRDLVKSELERGAVYWNSAHYPKHFDFNK
jgi:hypothetical protein